MNDDNTFVRVTNEMIYRKIEHLEKLTIRNKERIAIVGAVLSGAIAANSFILGILLTR